MKKLLSIAILAACVPAAFASTGIYTVSQALTDYNGADHAYVMGYISGITDLDNKVCPDQIRFGTITNQTMSFIQAAIDETPVAEANNIRNAAAVTAISVALERLYPCK